MNMKLKIGEFYYHFKHNAEDVFDHAYVIADFGYDLEHDKEVVFYKPLYNLVIDGTEIHIGVRSIENFTETVTRDGKTFPRFSLITDPATISQLQNKKYKMYGK